VSLFEHYDIFRVISECLIMLEYCHKMYSIMWYSELAGVVIAELFFGTLVVMPSPIQ